MGAYAAPTPPVCVQVMRTLLPSIKKFNKNSVGHFSVSGNACRDKVRRFLKVKFESLSDAEDAFNINYFDECPVTQEFRSTTTSTPIPRSAEVPHSVESPLLTLQPLRKSDKRQLPGSILDVVSSSFLELTKRQRLQLMVYLFKKWLLADFHSSMSSSFVPSDFLPHLSNALQVLFVNGKNNNIYDAVCCHGDMRLEELLECLLIECFLV